MKTTVSSTSWTSVLSSPLILIIKKLELATQKAAKRRSYLGSERSVENRPSLSSRSISFAPSTSVVNRDALRPLVPMPHPALFLNFEFGPSQEFRILELTDSGLTLKLEPSMKFSNVDLPVNFGPIIETTIS